MILIILINGIFPTPFREVLTLKTLGRLPPGPVPWAVIDTGVAYENYRQGWQHYYQAPDLSSTNFVPGYDFVNNDSHPNDDEGHGTHVTGTIAESTDNGKGVAGIAYGQYYAD